MNIGLSLPLAYLMGAKNNAFANSLHGAFGKPRDCMACLKNHGVTSVELKGFESAVYRDSLQDVVSGILDMGLHLTLHGSLSGEQADSSSNDIYSRIFSAIKGRQEKTIVVVHALEKSYTSHHAMVDATALALKQFDEKALAHAPSATISLEINRYHGVESPGTTYDGLLEIARHPDNTQVGFCWDMGHTGSSVQQEKLPAVPPAEFIAKTIHTHVHDLSPEGDTHWPLTGESSYLASCIKSLETIGYKGIYNLELYPTRWGAQQNVGATILNSILLLQKTLKEAAGHRQ